jgi:peroxiredoxin
MAAELYPGGVPDYFRNDWIVGKALPMLPLESLEGQKTNLQDSIVEAKAAVLVFWASYDAPWSDNLQTAAGVYATFGTNGVAVIRINEQEPPDVVRAFIKKRDIRFPVLLDADGSYLHSLHLPGSVEQVLVMDDTGKVTDNLSKPGQVKENLEDILRRRLEDRSSTKSTAPPRNN